jgi:A/G-specific adenine glycosylase
MIAQFAKELIDADHPGDFNQAMMEFGALYCKPRNPDCGNCIFKAKCKAYLEEEVKTIPVKTSRSISRKRYFHYLVFISSNEKIFLKKRQGNDIWKNLYDFPLIEKDKPISENRIFEELIAFAGKGIFADKNQLTTSKEYKHVLTHQIILAKFYVIELTEFDKFKKLKSVKDRTWIAVQKKDLHQYPVPRLIEIFLKDNFFDCENKD